MQSDRKILIKLGSRFSRGLLLTKSLSLASFTCFMFQKWSCCFNLHFKYLNRASTHFCETETICQNRRKQSQYIGHNLFTSNSDNIFWWKENCTNCLWLTFLIQKTYILSLLTSFPLASSMIVFNKCIFCGASSITEWLSSDLHINYPPSWRFSCSPSWHQWSITTQMLCFIHVLDNWDW